MWEKLKRYGVCTNLLRKEDQRKSKAKKTKKN